MAQKRGHTHPRMLVCCIGKLKQKPIGGGAAAAPLPGPPPVATMAPVMFCALANSTTFFAMKMYKSATEAVYTAAGSSISTSFVASCTKA